MHFTELSPAIMSNELHKKHAHDSLTAVRVKVRDRVNNMKGLTLRMTLVGAHLTCYLLVCPWSPLMCFLPASLTLPH